MTDLSLDGPRALAGYDDDTKVPFAIQVVSIIFFSGFAISVSIVAIAFFWPAGMALAAYFAYLWSRVPTLNGGNPVARTVDALRPQSPATTPSGNTSFDAYRAQLMERLEREQQDFQGFLDRLRDAKDRSEFDRFMDARADAAKLAGAQ